jgi:hypothetical protein
VIGLDQEVETMEAGTKKAVIRRTALGAVAALALVLVAGPAVSADGVDPEANAILREMSDYLTGLAAFRAEVDIDNEILDLAGQKLQLSSSASVVLERPSRIRMSRQGGIAHVEIVFDGKFLTMHSKTHNAYVQREGPETIDDALRTMQSETGIDVAAGDFFYADPYSGLLTDAASGAYLGWAYVNGVQCHHLAFRAEHVDWQLWVQTGDTPLPMKYVITSKWVTGAPQYTARFHNWNTKPEIEASLFEFTAPKGSKKLDSIPVNEAGQIVIGETQ